MSWFNLFHVIDTETTGLGPDARVVEIAVVTFEHGEKTSEWSQLINPGPTMDWENEKVKEALAVNHLAPGDLDGMPTFSEVIPALHAHLPMDVVVGHNLSFDLRMLRQEMARLDGPMPQPKLAICTKNLASELARSPTGNRLAEVAKRYNVVQDSAHRAAVDAIVCGQVLCAMFKEGKLPPEQVDMQRFCEKAEKSWGFKRR